MLIDELKECFLSAEQISKSFLLPELKKCYVSMKDKFHQLGAACHASSTLTSAKKENIDYNCYFSIECPSKCTTCTHDGTSATCTACQADYYLTDEAACKGIYILL